MLIPEFEPWTHYPDLTEQRLSALADVIRDVRADCVGLHDPENGDGVWSLGCRVYERTFNAIRRLCGIADWLSVNQEVHSLQFSFCVGSTPLRFYKGDPDGPPSRYLHFSGGEQLCLKFEGLPTVDTMLRLAIDVDRNCEASAIYLVEINECKEVVGKYMIPFGLGNLQTVTLMQAPPVTFPPVLPEPIRVEDLTELPKVKTNAVAS